MYCHPAARQGSCRKPARQSKNKVGGKSREEKRGREVGWLAGREARSIELGELNPFSVCVLRRFAAAPRESLEA